MSNNWDEIGALVDGEFNLENIYELEDLLNSVIEKTPRADRELDVYLISLVQRQVMDDMYVVFVVSVLMKIYSKPAYFNLLLEIALYGDNFTVEQKAFLLEQLKTQMFHYPSSCDERGKLLIHEWNNLVKREFRKRVHLRRFPKEERNKNNVIIM